MKECNKCHRVLSLDQFHIHNGGKFGVSSKCKECESKSDKLRRAKNKEYHELICATCNTSFKSFHKRKYCSEKCYPTNKIALVSICCSVCKKEFKQRAINQKFCSRRCSEKHLRLNGYRGAYFANWAKNNTEKINKYKENKKIKTYQETPKRYPSRRIYVKTCPITKKLFVSKQGNTKYSKEGHSIWKSQHVSKLIDRKCINCGGDFIGLRGSNLCSEECREQRHLTSARASRAKKKGATIIEKINPIYLFTRHGWRCAICHTYTPQSSIGTNKDDEPTMDHIIPLCEGGQHVLSNLQLACRSCNNAKGRMMDISPQFIALKSLHIKLNHKIYEKEQAIRRT